MKVLITGGAGYLGSVIAQKFLQENCEVTVLDNLLYDQTGFLHLFQYNTFSFVKGDVRDNNLLINQVLKHDVIIPLAAIVGMAACNNNPRLAIDVNFQQIATITKVLQDDQMIVLPNTNSQYGTSDDIVTEESPAKPLSLYAQTKCDAEKVLLDNGNGVVLRLATVFGVSCRMRRDLLVNDFVYKALSDGYIVLFESHFKRNVIHINDIANTFWFIIDNYDRCKSNIYNVGLSSANISKLELAERIKKYIPEFVIKIEEYKKDIDKRNYIVSNEKLESLGWKAEYDLDYGIQQLINSMPVIVSAHQKGFTNL